MHAIALNSDFVLLALVRNLFRCAVNDFQAFDDNNKCKTGIFNVEIAKTILRASFGYTCITSSRQGQITESMSLLMPNPSSLHLQMFQNQSNPASRALSEAGQIRHHLSISAAGDSINCAEGFRNEDSRPRGREEAKRVFA